MRATEPQRRGAIHFHALLGADGLREQPRLYWMDAWNEIAGFARIEEPKVQHAVDAYCSKYVAKEGQIDLSDSLRREHQLRFRLSGSRGS